MEYIVFVSKEHYNPLGIVRTLGEAGIRPIVVAVKGDLKFVGQSKYVKKKHYVSSPQEGLDLIINKYSNPKEKSYILTGDDVTVSILDENYDRLKESFYFYNAGEAGRITKFMDKSLMISTAEECGINIAKTWTVKVGDIPNDIEYPVMTKAINSIGEEWKDIVYVCSNDEELMNAYKKINSKTIILQKYVEKKDEVSFDAFSINKGKDVFFVMEAYQEYCLSDKYSPYWIIKNYSNYEIGEKIKKMISKIGLEGIFEFEFLIGTDNQLYFLEINFRNTALGFATTVAGMPQVKLWCDAMNSGYIDESKRVVIPEGFHAMAECFDYDVRVKTGILPRKEWYKQFFASECKMYKGRKDYLPFLLFMIYKQTKMKK